MPNTISNSLSLLGGAALGAVAMYLLDPDSGADRREDIAGATGDAVASTHKAVRSTASDASNSAQTVAGMIAHHAKELASRVGGHVSDATDAASSAAGSASDSAQSIAARIASYAKHLAGHVTGVASDAADSAADSVKAAHKQTKAKVSDAVDATQSYGSSLFKKAKAAPDSWLDTASDYADRAKLRARRALGEPEPASHVAGLTAGSIGVLVVGAGLMYYLDPERGRTRRALLRDKAYSITRQSGNKVRSYGHHLGNKAQGYAAQARQVVPGQWVEKAQSVIGSADTSDASHPA